MTPGEYEITASADGFAPLTKLIEITMNHEEHKVAPTLKFELEKATPGSQLAERSYPGATNDLVANKEPLFNHLDDVEGDQDLIESPLDWTSIAEQYAPYQDAIDMQDEEENNMNGIEEENGMPDYGYDYPELPRSYPTHEDDEEQYY